MKKRSSSILTLLIGVGIGVIIGMLFSPTQGATTRDLLCYQFKKLAYKLKLIFIQIIHLHHKILAKNDGQKASQAVIVQTMQKAKEILEEVKKLSHQLDE